MGGKREKRKGHVWVVLGLGWTVLREGRGGKGVQAPKPGMAKFPK